MGAKAVRPALHWSFQSLSLIGLMVTPAVPAGWPEVTEMAPVTDPAQRSCLLSPAQPSPAQRQRWLTSPQGDRQRWNGGGGNAPSSSELPPRHPSISCAIEMDAHRQGRPWWRALSDRPYGIRGWSDSNLADQRCTLLPLLPQPVAVELIEALTL